MATQQTVNVDDFKGISLPMKRATPTMRRTWSLAVGAYGADFLQENSEEILRLILQPWDEAKVRAGTEKLRNNFHRYVRTELKDTNSGGRH